MEWMMIIGDSLKYIENHIFEDITTTEIAKDVGVSPFYYQKGFSMLCGFTVSEYIRNRRLALAGNEIITTQNTILEIALKYGYDSPDSFTKAFTRFHGSTPTAVRRDKATLKTFAPLKIKVLLEGGFLMDYRIEKKNEFTVIANSKKFAYEGAKEVIPQFWNEHYSQGKGQVICGEFGINIDEGMGSDSFDYLIADTYKGQDVPDGFIVRTIPSFTWAIFAFKGAMPTALQDANTKIFTEWLPTNNEYEFAAGYCVEMYDDPQKYENGTMDDNYYCEIWIPVKKK